ncbi:MAG: PqqD family protein [Actinomycetota bacterium]|nr:PqqD family protein [Actinomycetota bacterium]
MLYRQVDKQMVLLHLEREQYFGLNEVGARIVTRLTEEPLEAALVALADDYEVDSEVLRRDVHNLIDALTEAGLLERLVP